MAKFARIVDGVVQETLVADELPPFCPEIAAQWQSCPDEVDQRWTLEGGVFAEPVPPEVPPMALDEALEQAFIALIPRHQGQAYCTGAVILGVLQGKVAALDALRLDPTNALAKAAVGALTVPSEMEADRDALLAMIP